MVAWKSRIMQLLKRECIYQLTWTPTDAQTPRGHFLLIADYLEDPAVSELIPCCKKEVP